MHISSLSLLHHCSDVTFSYAWPHMYSPSSHMFKSIPCHSRSPHRSCVLSLSSSLVSANAPFLLPFSHVPSTVRRVIWKKSLYVYLFQSQKNIFYGFLFLSSFMRKLGLGWNETSKNIPYFRVQRSMFFDPWSWKKKISTPHQISLPIFNPLFRVGPPHNRVDLGVTGSDLSFALIKTPFFSRNIWESSPWNPIGGSLINIDQSGFTTDFGSLFTVGSPHNGATWG